MKSVILKLFGSLMMHRKWPLNFNAEKEVEVVIYQFDYKYNGNEIADLKIKKLIKWHDRRIFGRLINALKMSNKSFAKFLPNHIIEITQEGKILFSILTHKRYFKCAGAIYKSLVNIDKYIDRLIRES